MRLTDFRRTALPGLPHPVFVFFFILLIMTSTARADCRGCCSGHGGVVCEGGITTCADGTPLSAACQAKGCSVCEAEAPVGAQNDAAPSAKPLAIANFNVQVFGVSKAGKPEVMEALGTIISHFDVVAIQEIRDKSGRAIHVLEGKVDTLGHDYDTVIGPRLGRTSSKEQYAYLYKSDALEFIEAYTFDDSSDDIFHREPFIAQFRAREGDFSFVLITLHTDPDDAASEINALPDVVADARDHFPDETRFMVLGDLNADCAYYDEDDTSSTLRGQGYRWLITNGMDTNLARSACTYDRIIITKETAPYFTGTSGIFPFDEVLGLSAKEAKAVSDHYPVYGIFTTAPKR
ncbi:endonuclease/exonuclease/phosphatase family protein [Desulfoluna spongiiphila]|uniref:Endonuclease/Exonuclease/phosphatase family protein n=1 Tax=Desulfoluna spongiiphila TaxID=419481 RepID=A0A1G5I563_9BACT|nr:endonuclease/exonuclease/phosphatase family protein [Desulfoluna spongiiphila]SCY70931.1 Endonuclease/Exonuclease/phosphatase family protein [Desulfoluna spongiiphila]